MKRKTYQVIIIGGGPAGLSAALTLGRGRVKTLVLNTETPRNKITKASHGFLTQDGVAPLKLISKGKRELKNYSEITYKKEKALKIEKLKFGFSVKTSNEIYHALRIILATGHQDQIASFNIKGLTKVYGISVFPCPFCDGYELANKPLAIFADAELGPEFAKTLLQWSNDIIVFTNGEKVKDMTIKEKLKNKGVVIEEGKIEEIISINGHLKKVKLEDGSEYKRVAGFLPDTNSIERVDFARSLNVPIEKGHLDMEEYQLDENKEAPIKGLFIIGDARVSWSGIACAIADGYEVGITITHQIIEDNWKG